jgi:hypothetical protein
MGETLGKLFHALWQEVAWLHAKWAEYVQLFGTKPNRIDLLNAAAPEFFRIVQDTLWDDTLLHIARLTERQRSGGKAMLTIQTLPRMVDEQIRGDIAVLVKTALEKGAFCRDWRNRHIAHRNLALALQEGAEPLAPASRLNVRQAIDAISEVLNAVSEHYQDASLSFQSRGMSRGAEGLLYVIDDGLTAEAERQERLQSGNVRPEDWKPRDL